MFPLQHLHPAVRPWSPPRCRRLRKRSAWTLMRTTRTVMVLLMRTTRCCMKWMCYCRKTWREHCEARACRATCAGLDVPCCRYLVQYPQRSTDAPYGAPKGVRFKPQHQLLEIEHALDTKAPWYDEYAAEGVKRPTLRLLSTSVPPAAQYAVGTVHDGARRCQWPGQCCCCAPAAWLIAAAVVQASCTSRPWLGFFRCVPI